MSVDLKVSQKKSEKPIINEREKVLLKPSFYQLSEVLGNTELRSKIFDMYRRAFAREPWNEVSKCNDLNCDQSFCNQPVGKNCPKCNNSLSEAYSDSDLIDTFNSLIERKPDAAIIIDEMQNGEIALCSIAWTANVAELAAQKYSNNIQMQEWLEEKLGNEQIIYLDEYFGDSDVLPNGKMSNFQESMVVFARFYGFKTVCFRTIEPKMITKSINSFGAKNVKVFEKNDGVPDRRCFVMIDTSNYVDNLYGNKENQRPAILIQDSIGLIRKLVGEDLYNDFSSEIKNLAFQYFKDVQQILSKQFTDIKSFEEVYIEESIATKLEPYLNNNEYVIVILDRFLGQDLAADNIARLSITREAGTNIKIPRIGSDSITQQIDRISNEFANRKIVIVDDAVFSGGSINYTKDLFEERGYLIDKKLCFISDKGWVNQDGQNSSVVAMNPLRNALMDIRDYGLLGGKTNSFGESIPYILPFSSGAVRNLKQSLDLANISNELLTAFKNMILDVEELIGFELTFADVQKAKFGIPVAKITVFEDGSDEQFAQVKPLPTTKITDFIDDCIKINSNLPIYEK
jgi:hypothetical protein